jgi:predicted phage terminase large subunit-like protein
MPSLNPYYEAEELLDCPQRLTMYGASDYATLEPRKGKPEPDFTEHGIGGFGIDNRLYFLDWWSGQAQTDKSIKAFIKLVALHKPVLWWNEGGLIDHAIRPAINRAMIEAHRFTTIETLPSMTNKGQKLQSFHARYEAGQVVFPIRRKWADRIIDQLVKFPAGRFDDGADVCGLFGRGLDLMSSPHVPSAERSEPELVPFTEKWLEFTETPRNKVRYF